MFHYICRESSAFCSALSVLSNAMWTPYRIIDMSPTNHRISSDLCGRIGTKRGRGPSRGKTQLRRLKLWRLTSDFEVCYCWKFHAERSFLSNKVVPFSVSRVLLLGYIVDGASVLRAFFSDLLALKDAKLYGLSIIKNSDWRTFAKGTFGSKYPFFSMSQKSTNFGTLT